MVWRFGIKATWWELLEGDRDMEKNSPKRRIEDTT
jgi:hypothetical protein